MTMSAMPDRPYEPLSYWSNRLKEGSRLAATGTRPFGEEYQRYLYRLKERSITRILRPYRDRIQDGRVLNVGCGWGYFEPMFKRMGAREVVGVDFVDETIRELKATRPEFEYHRANISEPWPVALQGRTFDLVTSIDVLYHIVHPESFTHALRNLCGACDPDGGLLMWSDAPQRKNSEAHPHCRYRTRQDYQPELERHGFIVRETMPMYHLFDNYWSWSEFAADHPRLCYPLMYTFDCFFARWGGRPDSNVLTLASRVAVEEGATC